MDQGQARYGCTRGLFSACKADAMLHRGTPEYADDMGETLDLTVLGGWWGSGKRGGKIGSLLCGLRNEQDPGEDGSPPT